MFNNFIRMIYFQFPWTLDQVEIVYISEFDIMDIAYKLKTKLLGTCINDGMKWGLYIKYLSASKICFIVQSIKSVMNPFMASNFHFAYFRFHLR
jgi:hypothetical protein